MPCSFAVSDRSPSYMQMDIENDQSHYRDSNDTDDNDRLSTESNRPRIIEQFFHEFVLHRHHHEDLDNSPETEQDISPSGVHQITAVSPYSNVAQ